MTTDRHASPRRGSARAVRPPGRGRPRRRDLGPDGPPGRPARPLPRDGRRRAAHAARARRRDRHPRALRPGVAGQPGRRRVRRLRPRGRHLRARARSTRSSWPTSPARSSSTAPSRRSPPATPTTRRSRGPSPPVRASAWGDHDDRLYTGALRLFRPGYETHLVRRLAARPRRSRREAAGRRERRRRRLRLRRLDDDHGPGVRALDVRRRSTATGRPSRRRAPPPREAGVDAAHPVRGRPRRRSFPGTGYDLVTMFDCLHDMGDPVGVARRIRESLAADGTLLLVEPAAGERLEDNLNPVGPDVLRPVDGDLHAVVAGAGGRARARRAGRPGAAGGGAARGGLLPRAGRHQHAVQPDHGGQAIGRRPIAASSARRARGRRPAEHHQGARPLVARAERRQGGGRGDEVVAAPPAGLAPAASPAARRSTASTIGLPPVSERRPATPVRGVGQAGQHGGLGPGRGVPRPPRAAVVADEVLG